MSKKYVIQRCLSIVPVFSMALIAFITMFHLKRNQASKKYWIAFLFVFLFGGSAVACLDMLFFSGMHLALRIIVVGILLAVINFAFVEIQIRTEKTERTDCQKSSDITSGKKLLVIVIAVAAVLVAILLLINILFFPSYDFPDENGAEDTSLAVITLDDILYDRIGSSAYMTSYSGKGSGTRVSGRLDEYDFDQYSYRCKKLNGIVVLQATKTESDSVTLTVDSTLDKGNLEIVVIVDGEYYTHVPVGQQQTVTIQNTYGKLIVVKCAGESAAFSASVERSLGAERK